MFTLIIGGASCGKSAFGEALAAKFQGKTAYIATMEPFSNEGRQRIDRHRKMREGKGFYTVEQYTLFNGGCVFGYDNFLLECISNLVANHMFSAGDKDCVENIANSIKSMVKDTKNAVIITNDVFCDGILYDEDTKSYLSALSAVNCRLAQMADEVYEVVVGIPIKLKPLDTIK